MSHPELECNGPRDCSGTERGCVHCGFAACGTAACPCAGQIECPHYQSAAKDHPGSDGT